MCKTFENNSEKKYFNAEKICSDNFNSRNKRLFQSDNGKENLGVFDEQLEKDHIPHLFIYPNCPQIDTFIERYNRTLQEEFIDYHGNLLLDVPAFNEQLMDYLLWHNGERPHAAHGNKWSPIQFLTQRNPEECKMWQPHTTSCNFGQKGIIVGSVL